MSARTKHQSFCIPQARCRLCQFQLRDGDSAIAAIQYQTKTAPFVFDRNASFLDEKLNVSLHMCGQHICASHAFLASSNSNADAGGVLCFHADCFALRRNAISPAFLAATEHRWHAGLAEERRRARQLRGAFGVALHRACPRRLPLAMWVRVAGYLVCEGAVAGGLALAARAKGGWQAEVAVDVTRCVYAMFVEFEGVRYVRELTNEPKRGEGELVLEPRPGSSKICRIVVGKDHLGVRELIFATEESGGLAEKKRSSGVWWEHICSDVGIFEIRTRSDGVKLRDIEDTLRLSNMPEPMISWPVANPTAALLDLAAPLSTPLPPWGLRMLQMMLNADGATGYSFAVEGDMILSMHAHHGEPDRDMYADIDLDFPSAVWLYMPMDVGEHVTAISQRLLNRRGERASLGIMFTTNRGRSALFGSHYPPDPDILFHQIYETPSEPTPIYFNSWDSMPPSKEVRYLGFEGPQQHTPMPEPDMPATPDPIWSAEEPWYFSSCRLDHVVTVTTCADAQSPHRPVTGVLVEHANGHVDCLGQFRFDGATERIHVQPCCALYSGTVKAPDGGEYIAGLRTGALLAETPGVTWSRVPMRGVLEWWFTADGTVMLNHSTDESG